MLKEIKTYITLKQNSKKDLNQIAKHEKGHSFGTSAISTYLSF